MRPKQSPASHGGGRQIGCSSVHLCDPQHGVPHRFRRKPKTQTARARRAFKPNGPGERLVTALSGHAHLFTLTAADIGLSDCHSAPGVLYAPELETVFGAVSKAFSGPFYAVAEIGSGSNRHRGRLHVHVIAHRDDGPQHVRRDSERCKQVYDAPGLYKYLAKAPEPYTLEAHLDLNAAEVISATGRPPRTRRHFLGPQRLAWAEAQCINGLTVTPTTPNRGEPAPQGGSTPLQPVTLNPEPLTHPDPTQRPAERPHPPVAKREQLESTSEFPKFPELKGEDGKKRKAKQSRSKKPGSNQLDPEPTTQPDLTDEPAPVATLPNARPHNLEMTRRPIPLRPTHERLSSPQRPAAPRPHRGGPSPGPAP